MKIKTNTNQKRMDYVSPIIFEQILHTEGLLCASAGEFSIENWENDNEPLTF